MNVLGDKESSETRIKAAIFISIESQVRDFHRLSSKYNFHGLKMNRIAFVRDGGKVETFDTHPYYFACYRGNWVFQNSARYDKNENIFWMKLEIKGLYLFRK